MPQDATPSHVQKFEVRLDFRIITIILLVLIAAMLAMWRPWQSAKTTDRTVSVTGTATVSARPDEFVFYPTYDFKNADRQAALDEMTAKSNELVAKLKELGVADKGIKTNSDSWSYPVYLDDTKSSATYSLRLTVTVNDEKLAQKVQDYLVTTTPSGTVTPQATFSKAKQKQLEDQARDAASKDARAKAEQSAKNLGFKLASVKTVNDDAGFGGIYPFYDKAAVTMEATDSRSSLTIQPGENDLSYTVTVTYFIR